jgi:flagellar basal body-associated protein FliL
MNKQEQNEERKGFLIITAIVAVIYAMCMYALYTLDK